jgi:hypothetical protein
MLNPRPKNALQAFVYKQYIVGILQGQTTVSVPPTKKASVVGTKQARRGAGFSLALL